ncbi:response regulator transcription factor [Methylocella sp.]|uniref:response regulator transcription factor n=1 Tax=Methylocella sp. TaxID=1978226 RepID=UPI0035B39E2F
MRVEHEAGDASGAARRKPILILEDESFLARAIRDELSAEGYETVTANTVSDGLEAARTLDPALIVADRMVADVDSLSMIESFRQGRSGPPVLFVSGLSSVDERIRALKGGGDDYLTKPFSLGELSARVSALLRRTGGGAAQTHLAVGPLKLDLLAREATRGERAIELLPAEFKLLEYMMRHAGQAVTRAMLLEDVWGYRSMPRTNLVDVHVGKLRRKVDADGEPPLLHSLRGVGFMLRVDERESGLG